MANRSLKKRNAQRTMGITREQLQMVYTATKIIETLIKIKRLGV